MKISTAPQEKIEVLVEDVKFIFRASVLQDLPFAGLLIEQANGEIGKVDRGLVTKYVFKALEAIDGEISTESGDVITVEKLKELAETDKLQAAFTMNITIPWALKILGAQGFLKLEPQKVQDEKKSSSDS